MNSEQILNETALVGIARLYSWSTNYDYPANPFAGFLDLIGYSEEEFGEKLVPNIKLDFISLDLIADAIKEFTNNYQDSSDLIEQLLESERN